MATPRPRTDNKGTREATKPLVLAKSSPQTGRHSNSTPATKEKKAPSHFVIALRTFGLKLFPSLFQDPGPEEKKIAIQKDRIDACIRSLVHVIPLAGAITLLILNFMRYYVGTFSSNGTAALQFAAKLHEMTMVSSLTTVLLSYVRYELVSKRGLPFGAIFASFRITELAYLWSPELWGSMTSKSHRWTFKLRLGLAIGLIALLVATVGPASAAAMIPRQDLWFYIDLLTAVNTTADQMFPTNLTGLIYSNNGCSNKSHVCSWTSSTGNAMSLLSLGAVLGNFADAATSKETINRSSLITSVLFSSNSSWFSSTDLGTSSTFYLQKSSIIGNDSMAYVTSLESMTSTQAQSLIVITDYAMDIKDVDHIGSGIVTTDSAMDAYAKIQCFPSHEVIWNVLEPVPPLNFGGLPGLANVVDYLTNTQHQLISEKVIASNGSYSDITFIDLPIANTNGVLWIESAFNYSSIEVGVLPQLEPHPNVSLIQQASIIPCTIELGWFPTKISFDGGSFTSQGPPQGDDSGIRRAQVDLDWLNTTNPFVVEVNMTAFQYMASVTGSTYDIITSTLLTTTLAAMSPAYGFPLIAVNASGKIEYEGGADFDIDKLQASGTSVSGILQSFPLRFQHRYYRSGYGYAPKVITVKISLAILILYCIVAIAHIVYSVISGISSAAWDSISELVALSINSRPTIELQNTCTGIRTTAIFEHKVRIASTSGVLFGEPVPQSKASSEPVGYHLELLFPSQNEHAIANVMVNTEYGHIKGKLD
ncbi:hypothetical protein L207DRAFT_642636 [Hyaloscypha variabilis F]|uniref:Uncharacterized protein n=1 Tax=Hyaloscypha variabilis (strain UAMH 11265 / GT02V1 / F) TaxID=1149755 RepID=A0A2J6QSF2_HYAVF|nr:hypothetical protein L207DRAFT_642636 [Hyaloscypha variabilis F]